MRISLDSLLPVLSLNASDYDKQLAFRLSSVLKKIIIQLNQVSEGGISAATNATTAAPTSGSWQQGDFVRNSAPAELGPAGSKYFIHGWICTAAGTPGTWKQARYLTGN